MMGYQSNGVVIPGTPIAIDFWKVAQHTQAKVFFLTHCHADHLVGLTKTWRCPIYTTSFNARWLAKKSQIPLGLFITLNAGCSVEVPLDANRAHKVLVTAIDAFHVPGAVMFLFQGYFGTVLYTGDFRYYPELPTQPGLRNLEEGEVDVLYLDNTYCHPRHCFPDRDTASISILNIIRCHPHHQIKLGCRNLGREELFVFLGLQLQEPLLVPPDNLLTLQLLRAQDVFTTDPAKARIHLVPMLQISKKNHELWNAVQPTISIRPTAMVVCSQGEEKRKKSIPLQCCATHPCCLDTLNENDSAVNMDEILFCQSTKKSGRIIPDDVILPCIQLENRNEERRDFKNKKLNSVVSSAPHCCNVVPAGGMGPVINGNYAIKELTSSAVEECSPSVINECSSSAMNECSPSEMNECSESEMNECSPSIINERSPSEMNECSPPMNGEQCKSTTNGHSNSTTEVQPRPRPGRDPGELGSQLPPNNEQLSPRSEDPQEGQMPTFSSCARSEAQKRSPKLPIVGDLKLSVHGCLLNCEKDSRKIFSKQPFVHCSEAPQEPAERPTSIQLKLHSVADEGEDLEEIFNIGENNMKICVDEQQACGERCSETMLSLVSPIKISDLPSREEDGRLTLEVLHFPLCSTQMEASGEMEETRRNFFKQGKSTRVLHLTPPFESHGNDSVFLSSSRSLPSDSSGENFTRLLEAEAEQPKIAAKGSLAEHKFPPSAFQFCKNSTKCLCSQIVEFENSAVPGMFIVPYSDHCDFKELRTTVSLVKPRAVVPVVRNCSWNVPDVEVYSDMSCFDDLLSTCYPCGETAWQEFVKVSGHRTIALSSSDINATSILRRLNDRTPYFQIPTEVWTFMRASAPVLQTWPRVRRKRSRIRRINFPVKRVRKGVHYEELL